MIEQLLAGMPFFRRNGLSSTLAFLRMIKNADEIDLIAQASEITGRGLLAGLAALRPGMLESELQDVIEDEFRALGAPRTSFASIVGSGPNSLILHYEENTRRMNAGEVVTVDVGAEFGRYAGDITRTLPVSGTFTARQREVYEVVLECQRRVIEACRPGITLASLNTIATTCAAEKGYGAFVNFSDWRHSTCHSLGLDVHDPFIGSTALAPGMVITVEPGIYLPAENLGVRIEDDVLITAGAPVILSSVLPRDPDGIEALMAGRDPAAMKDGRRGGKTPAVRRDASLR
jgi:Xaa-Pro aminopeptidase